MLRTVIGTMIGGLALVAGAGVAAAQDYPPDTPAPTAETCEVVISASGPMLPGATVDITLTCATIVAGGTYSGSIDGRVNLPATEATTDGAVVFSNIVLPADWETDAVHTATLVDVLSGQVMGAAAFYVDETGAITAAPIAEAPGAAAPSAAGLPLPATGSDSGGVVKAGALLVALGAGAILVARRRRTSEPVAA